MTLRPHSKLKIKDMRKISYHIEEMRKIAEDLNLPRDVVEYAESLLTTAFMLGGDRVLRHITYGKAMYYGAFLELAANDLGYLFPSRVFARKYSIRGFKLRNFERIVSEILGTPLTPSVRTMVKYYRRYLDLSDREAALLVELYRAMDRKVNYVTRFAAALAYLMSEVKGWSRQDTARYLNVTDRSVRRYLALARRSGAEDVVRNFDGSVPLSVLLNEVDREGVSSNASM